MPPLDPPRVPRKAPSKPTIGRHALKWRNELFGNEKYCYDLQSIIKLFNQISGYDDAPNPNKSLWGSCISALQSVYDVMHTLGVRGSDKQQQAKQSIAAALLVLDSDYKIENMDLMKIILPHEDRTTRTDWLDKCIARRQFLDVFDEPEFFCYNKQKHKKNSCVIYLYVLRRSILLY